MDEVSILRARYREFCRAPIGGVVVIALASQSSDRRFESRRRRLIHRPALTGKVGRVINLPAEARVRYEYLPLQAGIESSLPVCKLDCLYASVHCDPPNYHYHREFCRMMQVPSLHIGAFCCELLPKVTPLWLHPSDLTTMTTSLKSLLLFLLFFLRLTDLGDFSRNMASWKSSLLR